MRRTFLSVSVLLCTLFFSNQAWSQASVNESLETNFLYVDTVNGNDSNPGTQALPFKTIGKGVSVATAVVATTGSRIIVNPGTYRESITFANSPAGSLPITVEAATNGTVTVSGADVYTGWQVYNGNPQIYTNSWAYNWGLCPAELGDGAPYQTALLLRREMVFMNGIPLTQVLSLSDVVYPDMFYVDETSGVIYVWPPAGVDINSATVEVATRDPLVTVMGWNSLVFRGITFQYANSCHNDRAVWVEANSSNILFDTDTFQWNNAKGLNFVVPFNNVTVENSYGLHNGQTGFTDFQGLYAEYTNDTANYNNWRGAEGSYYSWAMGGFYFSQDHYATVSNLTAMYTVGNGYHWDTDNIQSTATNVLAAGNMLNGIFYEKDPGPLTLSNSTIADNTPNPEIPQFAGGGILIRNSENLTFTNNQIFGNGNSQLYITGAAGGLMITDWQYGTQYNLVSSYLTFSQDVMESTAASAYTFDDPFLNGTDWTSFYTTLVSGQNTWWNPSNSVVFGEPVPVTFTYVDFLTWQLTTLQDLTSTFQEPIPDPALTFVLQPPDYPDYWLAVDNSTLQVAADGTALFNISTLPVGDFTTGVSLFLDGISEVPGLSGSLNTSSIPTPGTATLSISSLPTILPGTYPLTVVSNAAGSGNTTKVVQFNVIIPTSSIRIVPATLNFPATEVNYTSAPLTTTITNYGKTTLTITSIVTSPQWKETDHCGGKVYAGKTCTLSVTFTPNAAVPFMGTMTVTDSDPTSPQIITLLGTGLPAPAVTLSSYDLAFGLQLVGTSNTMTSVLTNSGLGVLNISSIKISGTNAKDFAEADTCGGVVQPGNSCNINITFTPSATGTRSATCTLTDNAPIKTQTITLTGTGSAPTVKFSPTTLAFGNEAVGVPITKTDTLMNSGNGQLNITSITITGNNVADFSQTNTCGSSVPPFSNCSITVTFTPAATGSFSADVSVADNATGSPQKLALTGTGALPTVTFTPTSLAFGNQTVGKKSAGKKITVKNTGTVTLTLTTVALTGSNPGDYSFTKTCGTSLKAGQSCTATVFFDPTVQGSRTADLTFTDNAPNSPQNVALSGTGI